jgi:alkyldihydroxyacetonephosphate synthase
MTARERSWWGWGWADQQLGDDALQGLATMVADRFGVHAAAPATVDPARVSVPSPAVTAPTSLVHLVSDDPLERFRRSHGNAFRDIARAITGSLPRITDAVVRPTTVDEVEAVLDWCASDDIACLPFGGGTSVVGGVNPPEDPRPVVTLDLERLDRVTDVDAVSLAARIEGGAFGPGIEDQLRPHGLTLRHFPQSWEFSTLGGWLATRAGGHYATLATHIDDLTESIEAVTPTGRWTSRRLPGSGAGPSPDRLLLGSEGAFGILTAAWMRVQRRPVFRAQATVRFPTFSQGSAALRELAQSGLYPANCRLLDPNEALISGAGQGDGSVLVLGFESADHPLDAAISRALELTRDHGGRCPDGPRLTEGDHTGTAAGGAGEWRRTFLSAPYLRDGLLRLGMVVETFETAITWDRFDGFVAAVQAAARTAAEQVAGTAIVATRVTHAYPDGAAPYLTVITPAGGHDAVAVWDDIKAAASEAILAAGGTITHHHAVGRDHAPYYRRQRPERFGAALAAVKAELDPRGVLNPGVIVTPGSIPAPPTP